MKPFTSIFAATLLMGCAVASPPPSGPLIEILTLADAPVVLGQCSRPVPANVESFWVPTSEQVAQLEAALPDFIAGSSDKPAAALAQFNRQYAGFIRGGRKYIYGNFYGAAMESGRRGRTPVIICDGGRSVWGVVFDVESGVFSELEFNGVG